MGYGFLIEVFIISFFKSIICKTVLLSVTYSNNNIFLFSGKLNMLFIQENSVNCKSITPDDIILVVLSKWLEYAIYFIK